MNSETLELMRHMNLIEEDNIDEENFIDTDQEYIFEMTDKDKRMADNLFQQVHKLLDKRSQGGGNAKYRSSGRAFVNFRSEEHTSELQSRFDIVCSLL